MKNRCEKLFDQIIERIGFTLVKHKDGFGLIDELNDNILNIEDNRFQNAEELIDRLKPYFQKYVVDYLIYSIEYETDIKNFSTDWDNVLTIAKNNLSDEFEWVISILDTILNHTNEIDLNRCYHELWAK